jgi:hypothetical protein
VEPANNVRYARIQDSPKGNEIVGMRVPPSGLCSRPKKQLTDNGQYSG